MRTCVLTLATCNDVLAFMFVQRLRLWLLTEGRGNRGQQYVARVVSYVDLAVPITAVKFTPDGQLAVGECCESSRSQSTIAIRPGLNQLLHTVLPLRCCAKVYGPLYARSCQVPIEDHALVLGSKQPLRSC